MKINVLELMDSYPSLLTAHPTARKKLSYTHQKKINTQNDRHAKLSLSMSSCFQKCL